MRILHTSDLHLGARIAERDRSEEHRGILGWLLDTIETEKVDVLLIAGDVFDVAFPSAAVRADWYGFLAALRNRGCGHCLIIGGNHDSPLVLGAPRDLAAPLGVRIWGGAASSPSDRILDLGEAVFAALPYVRERDVRAPRSGEDAGDRDIALREAVTRYYSETFDAMEGRDGVTIGIGHLSVIGARAHEGARNLYVGGIGALAAEDLPPFDYLALGHFHGAQTPRKEHVVRYCGAPRASDFGEGASKTVTIVETQGDGGLAWREVEVPTFQPLVRLEGKVDDIIDRLSGTDPDAWIECLVTGGAGADLIGEQATEVGRTVLKIRRLKSAEALPQQRSFAPDLGELTEDELFRLRAGDAADHLLPLFRELVDEARNREGDGREVAP